MLKREASGADGDSASVGARIYEGMNNVDKQMLREYLVRELSSGSGSWREVVSQRVVEVVRRRAQCGESLDAHDVIDEVLSFSRSIIPAGVREGLFRRVSEVVGVGPRQ
ncbi:hypothetical protein DQ04_00691140 [Trypanosoma grayi]|uniref:hypothetical protein n=1 Tax=Trypanosoma grayi TaxID=71804 RepID=UPI0004F4A4AD|nr:hypothetical protein DQ04_00691140 [Trypanosoma grayi]KEG13968.1 hypothetical protein DQ04_00691140 [Trypanosoma grayi]